MKAFFLLFIITFNSLTLTLNAQDESNPSSLIKPGQQTPDFTFVTKNGENIHVSDLRGKLVMVCFFATWCGPCLQELPLIQSEVFEKYGSNDKFKLLVIGREHNDTELEKFRQNKGFKFDLIADPKREIYSKFATQFIPRSYLIDQTGKIIFSSIGFNQSEFDKLLEMIESNLN